MKGSLGQHSEKMDYIFMTSAEVSRHYYKNADRDGLYACLYDTGLMLGGLRCMYVISANDSSNGGLNQCDISITAEI